MYKASRTYENTAQPGAVIIDKYDQADVGFKKQ